MSGTHACFKGDGEAHCEISLLTSFHSPGQWQNPEDKSTTKNRLNYWIELAKLLERGKFNALFLG